LDIVSPMAGMLLRVSVAVGDRVAEGQEVAVLESMKMEVPVTAPGAGEVDGVLAEAGTFVQDGDPLVRLR